MENLSSELHDVVKKYLEKYPCALFEEVQDHVLEQMRTWVERETEDMYHDLKKYLGPDTLNQIPQSFEAKTLQEIKEWINTTLEESDEEILLFEFASSDMGLLALREDARKRWKPFWADLEYPTKGFRLYADGAGDEFYPIEVRTYVHRQDSPEGWTFRPSFELEKVLKARECFQNKKYQVKVKTI